MFDAFQLSAPGRERMLTLDVAPLSFFLMDNRAFRRTDRSATLHPSGLPAVAVLGGRCIAAERYGVIVTGQSLLQKATPWLQGTPPTGTWPTTTTTPPSWPRSCGCARSGRPALCLTGDVHYGQVVTATKAGTGAQLPR